MKQVLAFDVYGTLIDTAGVAVTLEGIVGDKAQQFSQLWRDKQLEYSFRRGLMGRYEEFSVCVRDSLDYTAAALEAPLSSSDRETLLAAYRELPAFDDAVRGLAELESGSFEVYAFSNGTREAVDGLLSGAGIRGAFLDIVSVDEVGTFKPAPKVYEHFLRRANVAADRAWLISGNPFDVLGAMAVGMRGVWVARSPGAVFDPWEHAPTLTTPSLAGLADRIEAVVDPAG